ncbi:MAG: hypothetical protein J6C44_07455 [Muribaculaceae bacterium]|nr:hypothetical protein [Muribaculaceae bacterium]
MNLQLYNLEPLMPMSLDAIKGGTYMAKECLKYTCEIHTGSVICKQFECGIHKDKLEPAPDEPSVPKT